ncbi:hypothetical protein ACLEUX_22255, partial [Escherichia coli]
HHAFSSGAGRTSDGNGSHASTLKSPSYTKSVSWQHYQGWGINQIASLLKKSNKTISAQKNSAMRRLAIHSNAEMYAWINSAQGARELNLPSVYGDAAEWNTAELRREMSHS